MKYVKKEIEYIEKKYETQVIKKLEKMNFPLEIIATHLGLEGFVCKQCSSCHNCR